MRNLLSHSSKLHLQLSDFFLRFQQILRVEISVRSHSLIQSLLLLESSFRLNILLLKFGDQVVLELDLLEALIILSVSLRGFNTVLLFVLFKLMNKLLEIQGFMFVALNLVLKLFKFICKCLDYAELMSFILFSSNDIFVEEISLSHFGIDLFSVIIDFFLLKIKLLSKLIQLGFDFNFCFLVVHFQDFGNMLLFAGDS